MIMATMVAPCAYDNEEPRLPIGNWPVMASKLNNPFDTSLRTVWAAASAFCCSDQTEKPSFSQRAGSWYGFRVAS